MVSEEGDPKSSNPSPPFSGPLERKPRALLLLLLLRKRESASGRGRERGREREGEGGSGRGREREREEERRIQGQLLLTSARHGQSPTTPQISKRFHE